MFHPSQDSGLTFAKVRNRKYGTVCTAIFLPGTTYLQANLSVPVGHQTMTAVAIAAPTTCDSYFEPHQDIIAALTTSSHSFLQPTSALHAAAVLAAKRFLDPLASSVSEAQELRNRASKKKRKRSNDEAEVSSEVLQLREVYTDGFGIGQIWEQAKKILDAARDEVERDLRRIEASRAAAGATDGRPQQARKDERAMEFDEEGFEIGSDDARAEDLGNMPQADHDGDLGLEDDRLQPVGEDGESQDDESVSEEGLEGIADSEEASGKEERSQTYVQDPNGLNDGFFSIDEFNRQSQFLEQQDARGEDDNLSEEEEIDWDADPLAMSLPSDLAREKLKVDDATGGEAVDGPTFGNVDLDLSSDDEYDDNHHLDDSMPGLDNTNDIKYADFFEPPAQKPSKSKRMRALPKTQPSTHPKSDEEAPGDIDHDIQRAISDVRRDLLDSEDEPFSTDDDDKDDQPPGPSTTKALSTHEKQRAKIAAEIQRLEAAAISKRDWTLSGEARAADRPVNSLIEEDLEFERVGKPIPIITAEVSEEIEALIKRRIIAREFDELVRRRPDTVGASHAARRGRVEIDDTKPSQGLADVYEAEHLKATDPGYVDKRSVALKKQHDEIEKLWKDVSAKLDVLSNLHFKPKRAEISVQVVTDKPTISMEDARPGAPDGGGAESRLAPQEIYTPGEQGKVKGEVMGKGGIARSKEEMTREEKLRRRRREKEKAKKKGSEAVLASQQPSKKGRKADKAHEKKNILDELRKGGVKVIGKKGDLVEIEGKKRKGNGPAQLRSTAYKL